MEGACSTARSGWGTVRTTIEKCHRLLAAQGPWVYWLGRAYRAGGRVEEANALFAKISGQPNFYGNLADDELGRPIMTPPKAAALSRELNRMAANPGVQRSLALFRVNLRTEGVREWNWTLRGMSDRELLAASQIAHRAGIYDRAVQRRIAPRMSMTIPRYLSPFSRQVRPAAKPGAGRCLGLRPDASGKSFYYQRDMRWCFRPDAIDAGDSQVGGEQDRAQKLPSRSGERYEQTFCSVPRICAW